MAVDFTAKAIDIVKQAVEKDNEEKYPEALALYTRAIETFMTALKYEKNAKSKETIRGKVNEYLVRAEKLREHIASEEKKGAKKVVKTGVSNGTSKKKASGDSKGDEEEEKDPLKLGLESAIVTEKPNVKWDDVAGLDQAKALLQEAVILPIKFPQLFTGKRTPWKGILLYGPPGTGKSYLAKAVATEANSTFLSVSSSDLVSKYQGESERLVRGLFELAREKKPAIIFIDEVDSLCGNRSDGENDAARRIKTEFLVQMDGVGKGNDGILVLGATNTPWDLDPAIRRRFQKRVYIPLPEAEARRKMLELNIGKTPHSLTDQDFEQLAHLTDGFSGSDLAVLVRDALYEPVRTCQMATHFKKVPVDNKIMYEPCTPSDPAAVEMNMMQLPNPDLLKVPEITKEDFDRARLKAKPSVGQEDLERQEEWTKQFGEEG